MALARRRRMVAAVHPNRRGRRMCCRTWKIREPTLACMHAKRQAADDDRPSFCTGDGVRAEGLRTRRGAAVLFKRHQYNTLMQPGWRAVRLAVGGRGHRAGGFCRSFINIQPHLPPVFLKGVTVTVIFVETLIRPGQRAGSHLGWGPGTWSLRPHRVHIFRPRPCSALSELQGPRRHRP